MEAAAPQGAPRPEEAVPLQRAVHVLRPRACRGRLDSLHHQQRDLGIEPAAAQSVAPPPQNAHQSQDQGDVVVALRAPREACAAANQDHPHSGWFALRVQPLDAGQRLKAPAFTSFRPNSVLTRVAGRNRPAVTSRRTGPRTPSRSTCPRRCPGIPAPGCISRSSPR